MPALGALRIPEPVKLARMGLITVPNGLMVGDKLPMNLPLGRLFRLRLRRLTAWAERSLGDPDMQP